MRKTARAILISKTGWLILIKRVKNGNTYYVTPGGGVETGETPAQAVIREISKETGCCVTDPVFAFHFQDEIPPTDADFFVCHEVSRHTPTGEEWQRDSSQNQYEIVEVSQSQFNQLIFYPSALKQIVQTYVFV